MVELLYLFFNYESLLNMQFVMLQTLGKRDSASNDFRNIMSTSLWTTLTFQVLRSGFTQLLLSPYGFWFARSQDWTDWVMDYGQTILVVLLAAWV